MAFALHTQKFTKADLKGLEIHNEREQQYTLSNKDIDVSRSGHNYDLGECYKNYLKRFNELRETKINGLVRKNSVAAVGVLVSADKEFFRKLTPEQEKTYFESVYNKISDMYGKENIISAKVHKDEATPHMHLVVCPITKDGRLSAKELFNKNALRNLQDIALDLQKEGFEIERGQIDAKNKHLSEEEFKLEQDKRKLEEERIELDKQAEKIQKKREFLLKEGNRLEEVQKSFKLIDSVVDEVLKKETLLFKGLYKIDGLQLQKIVEMAKSSENLLKEWRLVKNENYNLRSENEDLKFFKDKFENLTKENKSLKHDLKRVSEVMDKIETLGFGEILECGKSAVKWEKAKYNYEKRQIFSEIEGKPEEKRNSFEKQLLERKNAEKQQEHSKNKGSTKIRGKSRGRDDGGMEL